MSTEDFEGKIDGKGVKQVMSDPKCPLQLIPPMYTEGVASVLMDGAFKYAPNNWMRGMSFATVLAGIERHTLALKRGEDLDPDSGLPHVFHLSCGAMFLAWYLHGPNASEYAAFDDRQFKEGKTPLVRDLEDKVKARHTGRTEESLLAQYALPLEEETKAPILWERCPSVAAPGGQAVCCIKSANHEDTHQGYLLSDENNGDTPFSWDDASAETQTKIAELEG